MNCKCILSAAFLFVLWVPNSLAGIRVGLIGSVQQADLHVQEDNPFDVDPDDFHIVTGYGFGVALEFDLTPNLALCLEPMFLRKGSSLEQESDLKQIFMLSYIELPVVIKIAFGRSFRPYLLAGPSVGVFLDGTMLIEGGMVTGEGNIKHIIKKADFGLCAGTGLSYVLGAFSFFLEGRVTFGMRNVNEGGTVDVDIGGVIVTEEIDPLEAKTYQVQILGGVAWTIRNIG